jgi:hypothetical protein
MKFGHDLSGLMQFVHREEWSARFDLLLQDHCGSVLRANHLEYEDMERVLDDHWSSTLWGCVFEDLLTREFGPKNENIVDTYLRRLRRLYRKDGAEGYMKALRGSVMSLHEVSDVVPGQSFKARDLLLGGEPILILEQSGSRSLKQWDRIAVRVVEVSNIAGISGGVLPFSPRACDILFDLLREATADEGARPRKAAQGMPRLTEEALLDLAPRFTTAWLIDALPRFLGKLPALENSDGDSILFHEIAFPIAKGTPQKQIAALLNVLSGLRAVDSKFWNWVGDKRGVGARTSSSNAETLDTTMEDGAPVLGNVELKGRMLSLSVNAAGRAERGVAMLQKALGPLIGAPEVTTTTVDELMAREKRSRQSAPAPQIPAETVHELLTKHYRETLDLPVAMLGNQSPRDAIKTRPGRQKVADWLKYLESQTARNPDPNDPLASYDFRWMWRELGIEDLRR